MHYLLTTLLLSGLIAGCQSTSSTVFNDITNQSIYTLTSPPLFDEYFQQHKHNDLAIASIVSENEIFALDDEMKLMVSEQLKPERNHKKRAAKLLTHLFDNGQISLSYEVSANITARETYHRHVANCLSLTIMAYALAEEADLNVEFQHVEIPEYWVRNGQYNLLAGHVNLLIKNEQSYGKTLFLGSDDFQIDFDPQASRSTFNHRVIDKNTVVAMFYNNKGAEYLVDKNYVFAYQYFKAAVTIDPKFSPGWGNLGVLYKKINQIEAAKFAYQYAINLDNNNLTALENLGIILTDEKNYEHVQLINNKLQTKRENNPYYYAMLADEYYYKGINSKAILNYKKAISLQDNEHEFYFGLSKAYYKLGLYEKSQKALNKAIKTTDFEDIESMYVAKLNFLRSHH